MKVEEGYNKEADTNFCEENNQTFAEAKKSYLHMLAKLLAIEILIEEGIIDKESSHLLEE